MAKQGKDYEFVEELPKSLSCSICMKVLCQPHCMNCCEQLFCQECLEKWLKCNKTCPHCRSTDFSHMLMQRPIRKIGELKMYCLNKKHGCKCVHKVSESEKHTEECQYQMINCLKCDSLVLRGCMKKHTKELCPRRPVSCTHCKVKGEHQFIVGDHLNDCELYQIKCPQKCGTTLLHKFINIHKSICPMEVVPCLYSELGCDAHIFRKDMEKHIASSAFQHMMVLAKSHLTLKAEHRQLELEHKKLQEEHKKGHSDLTEAYTVLKQSNQAIREVTKKLHRDLGRIPQVAQIQTLLSDSTDIKMGDTLILTLSESNKETGHHYIHVTGVKFKLEWKWSDHPRPTGYIFKLFQSADMKVAKDVYIPHTSINHKEFASVMQVAASSFGKTPDNYVVLANTTYLSFKHIGFKQIGSCCYPHQLKDYPQIFYKIEQL